MFIKAGAGKKDCFSAILGNENFEIDEINYWVKVLVEKGAKIN